MASGSLVAVKMLRFSFDTPEEEIPYWIGWINASFMWGAFMGALIGSQYSMKIGRIRTLMYNDSFGILAHIVLYVFQGFWVALLMRFASGVGAGITMTLILTTLSEQLPKKYMAEAGGIYSYIITAGLLCLSAISFVGSSADPNEPDMLSRHWKCIIGLNFFFHIGRVFAHVLFFNIDTPKFYVEQMLSTEDPQQAEKYSKLLKDSLKQVYQEDDVPAMEEFLVATQRLDNFVCKPTLTTLLKKPYRRPLLSNLVVALGYDVAGVNFFAFFAIKIFEDIGGNASMALLLGTLMRLVGAKFAIGSIKVYGLKCS